MPEHGKDSLESDMDAMQKQYLAAAASLIKNL